MFRTKKLFLYLVAYFAPYRRQLALGTVCLLLANLLGLASPSVLRHVIDGLMNDMLPARLIQLGGLIVFLAIAQSTMLFFQRTLLIGVARNVEAGLRNDFYGHLQKLPLPFYQSRRTGDLMVRATSDMAAIRTLGGLGLIATLNALFAVTMVLPAMIVINWKLTALAFLPLPLLALTCKRFSNQIHERARIVQESYGRLSSRAQEMTTGIRVARAYRQEQSEISKFRKINSEYVTNNIALIRLSSAFRPILQFFIGLGFVIVFAYGGYLVVKGVITTGQFVQQTLYLNLLVSPVASFGFVVNLYQRAMASMDRIHSIMSIKPSISTHDDVYIRGEIEFRNLTFKYNNAAEPVLKNINLRIAPGQTVAVVGGVGSGKSTLIDLVCRLIDAPRGQLLIDGRPIQDIPLRSLRSAIGCVSQETILFTDSIAANIAFGMNKSSRETVEKAAEEAALAGEIRRFPQGFDTVVGERGLTLSGGQKQRATIARAVAIDPRILILDDALSSVDAETEDVILRHLRQSLKSRTGLIVSHRLSTVKDADLIVVLEDGYIVERGTHDELLAYNGVYAELYDKQQLEQELSQI
jgi:ATP-binding cassette subfamily B protein